MQYASFGSISSGTMRPEDLIPDFAWELKNLATKNKSALRKDSATRAQIRQVLKDADKLEDYDSEEASEILDELFSALEYFAPPYAYFGSHPGDGADYGFWLTEDLDHCFDGLRVNDTSEVPTDYSGEVIHVNDHGNTTLYAAHKGKLREVWAIV